MKKLKIIVTALLAVVMLATLTSCGVMTKNEKTELAAFYSTFVEEATTLDPVKVKEAYDELAAKSKDFEGQDSNKVRDLMFSRFQQVNPEFFSKLYTEGVSYSDVGNAYSKILLIALASQGQKSTVDFPLDAISVSYDKNLKRNVYSIDRTLMTAVVPLTVEGQVTQPKKQGLAPVKLVKMGDTWQVVADANVLSEIGVPKTSAADNK